MKKIIVTLLVTANALIFATIALCQSDCTGDIKLKIIPGDPSEMSMNPESKVVVPEGYKILGGGATLNYEPGPGIAGTLLYASYPASLTEWRANGKAHKEPYTSSITAYAIAIYDPAGCWDVIHEKNAGLYENNTDPSREDSSPNPEAIATLPSGYVLTGGGARVVFPGRGNLIYASYPISDNQWMVKAKQHCEESPNAHAWSYVIGIKPTSKNPNSIINDIQTSESNFTLSPSSVADVLPGYKMSGGGGSTFWKQYGSLLFKSYPTSEGSWKAHAKAHCEAENTTITSYAIGIKIQ